MSDGRRLRSGRSRSRDVPGEETTNQIGSGDPERDFRNAYAAMLAKLGRRDHTEKELTTALRRKLAPEAAIERALAKLRDQGLVDDRKFAERRARSAASSGLRGPRRVVAALRQKGVAAETASSVAKEAFSPTSDLEEKLVKLAARQLRRARAETGRERRMKALRALVSRGFGLGESRRAIARAEKAEGEGDPDGA